MDELENGLLEKVLFEKNALEKKERMGELKSSKKWEKIGEQKSYGERKSSREEKSSGEQKSSKKWEKTRGTKVLWGMKVLQ